MGRHQYLKPPDHLYVSPPIRNSPSSSSTVAGTSSGSVSSFLAAKSAISYTSSAALFHETGTSAFAVGDRIPGFKTSAGEHTAAVLTGREGRVF